MNYLESSEYKDARSQLNEEYEVYYNKIENYILLSNFYALNQESCLIQILDDFLSAQAEGKPVASIIGSDVKKYCNTMIQAERSRRKSKYEGIAIIAEIPLAIMILALASTFFDDDKLAFKFHSITIGAFAIVAPLLSLGYYIIKGRIAKALFNHTKASRIIIPFIYVLFWGGIYSISFALNKIVHIVIPVPFPLFVSISAVSLALLFVIVIIERKNNNQLKIIPDREEYTIEQVTCPNCGKGYDMDYPRCPYCKYNTNQ